MNKNEFLEKRLGDFKRHIDEYRGRLNEQGIWMFLGALGCWGVNDLFPMLFAIVIIFLIFTAKVFEGLKYKVPYIVEIKKIKRDIENLSENENQKLNYTEQLKEIENKTLSFITNLRATWQFSICYAFMLVTIVFRAFPEWVA